MENFVTVPIEPFCFWRAYILLRRTALSNTAVDCVLSVIASGPDSYIPNDGGDHTLCALVTVYGDGSEWQVDFDRVTL